MNPRWLLRMKRLAQNPPSLSQIFFIATILAACAAIYAVESIWGWPAWLTVNKLRP